MRSTAPSSPPHTPSHPPPAHLNFAGAGAPVKASGGRGFPSVEDQVKNSPSKSAEKVARRKGRASTSTPSGAKTGEVSSGPRRASFSLSFTPIRPVADKMDFDSAASSPAVLARQQQGFQSSMHTSNSKAHAYVAPHRRPSSSSTTTPSSYSPKSLSYYDRSSLPPAEDSYFSASPSHSGSRSSASYASARASLGSLASSTSPHVIGTNHTAPSTTYTHKSRSSSGSWKYANEFPPPSPASAIISRGPYEDPPRHPHPLAIPESEELESNDASSWADEVEEYERSGAYDDDEEEVEYEPDPSEWSRRPSLADGEELEFLVRIGKRKGSSAFMTSSGIDVPSPVWEEHFDEEELRIPTSASVSRKVDIPKSRKVLIGPATILDSEESDENVCTGCGTPPVPSFVALVPCDHLVCHTCLNALINAAAHKPPRPTACFACGSHVDSFLPAWEGIGAAAGGRIGLVEALQESLRNGEGRKPIATDPIAPPVERRSERRTERTSRRSSSSATVTSAATMKVEEGKENVPDVAEEGRASTKNRNRSSSSSSMVSVVGHGAHLLSPLSLKSKKSRSVLATGSLSLVEYEASASSSPLLSRSSSTTANASKTNPSTPSRPPLMSRSNSFSLSRSRKNSRSVHSPSHTRYGTDETEMDPATPDLSTSFTPYKLVEAMGSGPQTPVALGGAEAQVMGSGGVEWIVQEGNKSSHSHAEAPPAPIDWPVVRLDNIPWDITVAEVEDWLPVETLAPIEQCVMAVHILCNRSDGRTLNQCYIEAASVAAARMIVRSRDGKKMRHRPVHVTLSNQGEFLNTIFPTYDPGFIGLQANKCITPCPLLMQTELTGLLSLCKLESPHAAKIKERPYFNIISILQKFPWYQPETWNSQQIVRLYNTSCAAVEILGALQNDIPEWLDILTALADAVVACPAFRPHQKAKLIKKTVFHHSRYPHLPLSKKSTHTHTSPSGFSFSPPSLRETFVTVNHASFIDEGSPNLSHLLNVAPSAHDYDSDMTSPTSSPKRPLLALPSSARLSKTTSAPNLFSPGYTYPIPSVSPQKKSTPASSKHRRVSSIAKQLGVDDELVKAVVEQLGLGGGGRV